MKLNQILQKSGLNQKEADLYLAVLEAGEISLTELSKKAKIPRTSCYGLIEQLIKKGFVIFMVKRKKKYYFAENPANLLKLLEEKKSTFEEALPRFKALYNISEIKPKIRFYEGVEGIEQILQEIINEKRNFLTITSIDDAQEIIRGEFSDFIENRIKHNLRVKLLTNHSEASKELKKSDGKELRETRFVSTRHRFKTANFIFGNKTAIISLKKNPLGILIEDEDITETFRMYFEIMWASHYETAL